MKKVLKYILSFFVGIGVAVAFFFGWLLKSRSTGEASVKNYEEVKNEVKNEIQNTPAGDLVNSAPNADELRSNAAGIAGKFSERLRNRVREIISGMDDSGTLASGGN